MKKSNSFVLLIVFLFFISCERSDEDNSDSNDLDVKGNMSSNEALQGSDSMAPINLPPENIPDARVNKSTRELFKKAHPNAEIIIWETYPEITEEVMDDSLEVPKKVTAEFSVVTFKEDSSIRKVKFDKNGKIIETIK